MNNVHRIAVAGAINTDILAYSKGTSHLHDSNPGVVSHSYGGVGLNIARNLILLGASVDLVSAVGSTFVLPDRPAEMSRMNLDNIATIPGYPSSTYVALHDDDGDMLAAISDMRIYDELDPALLMKAMEAINKSDLLVIDTNLNQACLEMLTSQATVPILCDPVSITKSERILPFLSRLTIFKPNAVEAAAILAQPVDTLQTAVAAAKRFVDLGVDMVCLSLGSRGMILADNKETVHVYGRPRTISSATGAGDAMAAMLSLAYCDGADIREIAVLAIAASLATLEHEDSVNPSLTNCYDAEIRNRITLQQLNTDL